MSDADQLKAYLADRDAPCPGCGYNLRGATTADCPECGEQLYLHQTLRSMGRRRVHWAWFVLPFLWQAVLVVDIGSQLFLYPMGWSLVIEVAMGLFAPALPAVLLIAALRRRWHRWQIPWVIGLGIVVGLSLPVVTQIGRQLILIELGW